MTMAKQNVFNDVLTGRFENLPDKQSNIVKIFLSSTFTDTHGERDYLLENVYPSIRNFCMNKYGLDFQIVDMRWGVTDDSTVSNLTTKLCIDEISDCERTSVGPYFVAILSHKYGQRFIPSEIITDEYELLRNEMIVLNFDLSFSTVLESRQFKVANLFEYCYYKDENGIPSSYKLLHMNKIIPGFSLHFWFKDESCINAWKRMKDKLQNNLRLAAESLFKKSLLTKTQMQRYFTSITEEEISNGILRNTESKNRTFVIIREITALDTNIHRNLKLASKYIELDQNNQADNETIEHLNTLKERIRSCLPSENIFETKVKWSDIDGVSKTTCGEYMKNFGQFFFDSIERILENTFRKPKFLYKLDKNQQNLYHEILDHAHFCVNAAKKFHGREEILNKITKYILNGNNKPFIIYGESGSGKTSIIAKVAFDLRKFVPDGTTIIIRFLGTTRLSSNIFSTLKSVCAQLRQIYKVNIEENEIGNLIELKAYFQRVLNEIAKTYSNNKIVIFLDSIDQLTQIDYNVQWMLTELPVNVKMIYSTLKDYCDIFNSIQQYIPFSDDNYLKISSLEYETVIEIVKLWLNNANRSLNSKQWKALNEIFQKAELLPLFIKLVFDIVVNWTSIYEPDDAIFKCTTIDNCIKYLFRSLETYHEKMVLSRCVFYLTVFENGISENELEDILSIDDDLLTDVYKRHEPSETIRRFPVALWSRIKHDLRDYLTVKELDDTLVVGWYHRKFIEVLRNVYVDTVDSAKRDVIMSNVVQYFIGTWSNKPKPFVYSDEVRKKKGLKSVHSEAYRNTKAQEIEFVGDDGVIRYNKRKLKEFPSFILKLTDNYLKLCALRNFVYFDYDFMHAKAVLKDMAFLNEIQDILWRYFNETNMSITPNGDKDDPISELTAIGLVYSQNVSLLYEFPDAISMQLQLRLFNYAIESKNLNNFLKHLYGKSLKHCSLLAPYNYLPLVNEGNSISLIHDANIKCIISWPNNPYLFVLSTGKIYFISTEGYKIISNYESDELNQTKQIFVTFDKSLFRIITYFKSIIYSFIFDGKAFRKDVTVDMKTNISEIYLLSNFYVLVCCYNDSKLNVVRNDGSVVLTQSFKQEVKYVLTNAHINEVYSSSYETKNNDTIVIVVLVNGNVNVFRFLSDDESLRLLWFSENLDRQLSCGAINDVFYVSKRKDATYFVKFSLMTDSKCFYLVDIYKQKELNGQYKCKIKKQSLDKTLDKSQFCEIIQYFEKYLIFSVLSSHESKDIYAYDTEHGEYILFGKNCNFLHMFGSVIISFTLNSIIIQKIRNNSKNKIDKLSEWIICNSVYNKYEMVIKDDKLIALCTDESIKRFDLTSAFDKTLSNAKPNNNQLIYGSCLCVIDDDHIIIPLDNDCEIVVVDVSNQNVIEKFEFDEIHGKIEQIHYSNNFVIVASVIKGSIDHIKIHILFKQSSSNYKFKKLKEICCVGYLKNFCFYTKDDEQVIVSVYDSQENCIRVYIVKNKNPMWVTNEYKVNLDKLGILNQPPADTVEYVQLTDMCNYLIVIKNTSITYLSIKDKQVVAEIDKNCLENNKNLTKIDNVRVLEDTDDMICTSNEYLFYINLCQNEDEIETNIFKIASSYYEIHHNLIFVQNKFDLKVFDLKTVRKSKSFDNYFMNLTLNISWYVVYRVDESCNYLALFELPHSLTLIRLSDQQTIARVPVHREKVDFVITDSYITFLFNTHEIFSLLIVDPTREEHKNRIKQLFETLKLEDKTQNNNKLTNYLSKINPLKMKTKNVK